MTMNDIINQTVDYNEAAIQFVRDTFAQADANTPPEVAALTPGFLAILTMVLRDLDVAHGPHGYRAVPHLAGILERAALAAG